MDCPNLLSQASMLKRPHPLHCVSDELDILSNWYNYALFLIIMFLSLLYHISWWFLWWPTHLWRCGWGNGGSLEGALCCCSPVGPGWCPARSGILVAGAEECQTDVPAKPARDTLPLAGHPRWGRHSAAAGGGSGAQRWRQQPHTGRSHQEQTREWVGEKQ